MFEYADLQGHQDSKWNGKGRFGASEEAALFAGVAPSREPLDFVVKLRDGYRALGRSYSTSASTSSPPYFLGERGG